MLCGLFPCRPCPSLDQSLVKIHKPYKDKYIFDLCICRITYMLLSSQDSTYILYLKDTWSAYNNVEDT